jgi:hypothetical protein
LDKKTRRNLFGRGRFEGLPALARKSQRNGHPRDRFRLRCR